MVGAPPIRQHGDDAGGGEAVEGQEGGLLLEVQRPQGAGALGGPHRQQQVAPPQKLRLRTTRASGSKP